MLPRMKLTARAIHGIVRINKMQNISYCELLSSKEEVIKENTRKFIVENRYEPRKLYGVGIKTRAEIISWCNLK
jgi:hypothetical protein